MPELHPKARHVAGSHHILPHQLKGFLEGGISAVVAGVSTHPMDLIKVRMQLLGESLGANPGVTAVPKPAGVGARIIHAAPRIPFAASPAAALSSSTVASSATVTQPGVVGVTAQILRTEGIAGLFSGVSATALRQLLYSSSRMVMYEVLKSTLEEEQRRISKERGEAVSDHVAIPITKKVAAGLVAGGLGAAIGNPAELVMVRMQADGRLPIAARRNYKNVGDALCRIAREEGALTLWRGCGPTMYRAMAITAGQLAAYDQAKEFIHDKGLMQDGIAAHAAAAFTGAIVASLAFNPFGVVKTRLMNMKRDPITGLEPYNGAMDCAIKTVQAEGPLALYKGIIPTIARQGPFSVILFVTLEQVRLLFSNL